jgi:YD repeat-containing protein
MTADRYTWCDMDTHGVVCDAAGNVVSRHDLIRDAEAEAGRLNAQKATPFAPTTAWAYLVGSEVIAMSTKGAVWQLPHNAPLLGHRIARVRIEEISE